ncbi:MAG: hypothetical protein MUE44_16460 [Oscillatoriaceae cyanobacterium Prado104]|jgi:hypothetical protein|nr:hypothetical protein [Oscillatoriaceae cyanobacterium Prado104]
MSFCEFCELIFADPSKSPHTLPSGGTFCQGTERACRQALHWFECFSATGALKGDRFVPKPDEKFLVS